MENSIVKYNKYDREEIYNIFAGREEKFEPKGAWGVWGIMKIPNTVSDYIFYVTLSLKNGVYSFDEGISNEGILTWQSQHKQTLNDKAINDFINHDEMVNDIHLFVRPDKKTSKYSYLGKLAYVTHDNSRECPVHFKWRILDWNKDEAFKSFEISDYVASKQQDEIIIRDIKKLILVENINKNSRNRVGLDTYTFHSQNINFEEENERNSALGKKGEEAALKFEKEQLIKLGREDLANKVELTSKTQGNNAPFDIMSYDAKTGKEKYIEVKTTKGDIYSPFFISAREMQFSKEFKNKYYLYRIFEFNTETNAGKLHIKKGSIEELCNKKAVKFKCEIQ